MARTSALLLALSCGCGPVMTTGVIDDADLAIARAHAVEAEKYALYEATLADLYLVKAKEEQGHARYSDAQSLAADAIRFADRATLKAAERRASAAAQPPAPAATVKHPDAPAEQRKAPIDPGEQK